MKGTFTKFACALVVAWSAMSTTSVVAQQAANPAASSATDFNGVWLLVGGGGGGNAAFNKRPQSQWSTEMLPFTPQGKAAFEATKPGKGPRQVKPVFGNDPLGNANPPGLYRTLVYARPFEFVQTKDKIVQLFEWARVWRNIFVDGRPVPADVVQGPFWYGWSVGHWEGDTLVVTTLGLDGRAWADEWGTQFSDNARIEERWRKIAPDKLQLTITVNDPDTFTKPWTSTPLTYTKQTRVEPQEIIMAPIDEAAFNQDIRNPAGLPGSK